MKDRRAFDRINLKVPLDFLNPINGKKGEAETANISANGLSFVTKEELSVDVPLEMWLNIPDYHEPFCTRGRIVWSLSLANTPQKRVGVALYKEELIGLARVLWLNTP